MADKPGHTSQVRVAARALILRDEAVLLQVCTIGGREVYLLPGGGQEPGETLAEAVVREVREETGLVVAAGPLLWVREFIPRRHGLALGGHDLHCIFACTLVDEHVGAITPAPAPHPDAAQIDVRWVALAVLAGITLWPESVHRRLCALADDGLPLAPEYLGEGP